MKWAIRASKYALPEAINTPSWYARPGKNPRSASGDSSLMCAGMTPQAPCTMNCIRNPPATISGRFGANTHIGMSKQPRSRAVTTARRRPLWSEKYPNANPPQIAPTMENAVRSDVRRGLKPCCCCRYVGYMSWVPCEMKFAIAISTTRYKKRCQFAKIARR